MKAHGERLRNYTDGAVGYFASKWAAIRASAAIFAGLIACLLCFCTCVMSSCLLCVANLLAAAPLEDRRKINCNAVVTGKHVPRFRVSEQALIMFLLVVPCVYVAIIKLLDSQNA